MGALANLADAEPGTGLVVRKVVHDAYNQRLQAELDTMIWGHPSIKNSWYRGPSGRIFILSPWRMVDYWDWTRIPDPADFEMLSTPPR
jgi:4-hydroxyacetophenone monooxygenase